MNDELKLIWKEMVVAWSRYCASICLKKLKKPQKNSIMVVCMDIEIRIEYFPILVRHHYISLFGL
jgi:hypothetical protein